MRTLLVEDEKHLAREIQEALEAAGYAVDLAHDGEEAEYLGHNEPYDLVILDLGLPKLDGLTVLKRWRAQGRAMSVLILSARSSWHERVEGIDNGADDYLVKPFRTEELLARVRALLRRAHRQPEPILYCGDVALDTRSCRVTVSGSLVHLTAHEYRLLAYLMHHPGRVFSRTDLMEHIYASGYDRDSNTIEVFIGRLRRKLKTDLIETVRGLGYRLKKCEPSSSRRDELEETA